MHMDKTGISYMNGIIAKLLTTTWLSELSLPEYPSVDLIVISDDPRRE